MTLEEMLEPRHPGEYELKRCLRENGYKVKDVSEEPGYWDKDIDLLVTNPNTNITTTIEVKWDRCIAATGNMFIETVNPRSKSGNGWFKFCEADVLAYGDAINKSFYLMTVSALKDFINNNKDKLQSRSTWDGSTGYIVPLSSVAALIDTVAIV